MTSRENSPSRTTLPLNINIGRESNKFNNKNKLNENEDIYKKYIIESNISLHEENQELKILNINLKNDISQKMEEIDKFEEQIRYMRGLLHNLALIKEKSSDLANSWEKQSRKSCKIINKYFDIENINWLFNLNLYNLLILFCFDIFISNDFKILNFIFYQTISLSILLTYIKIIKQEKFPFKYLLFKNYELIKLEFKENLKNIYIEQTELISKNIDIQKTIDNIESGCISVSNFIDNI